MISCDSLAVKFYEIRRTEAPNDATNRGYYENADCYLYLTGLTRGNPSFIWKDLTACHRETLESTADLHFRSGKKFSFNLL
jgi:hypothetical protein